MRCKTEEMYSFSPSVSMLFLLLLLSIHFLKTIRWFVFVQIEINDSLDAKISHVSSLVGHDKCVNCVRVSPKGDSMVSGGDGGEIFLWHPCEPSAKSGNLIREDEASSRWKRSTILTGHSGDVLDMAWSSDSSAVLSGSVDNKAFIWRIEGKRRGQISAQLYQHKHFVQGVAWDPALQYLVTQSSDRTAKIFTPRSSASMRRNKINPSNVAACDSFGDPNCAYTINKRREYGTDEHASSTDKPFRHPLFLDEVSLPSFFRRPGWSPDGSFLVLPSGTYKARKDGSDIYTAYIFARGHWDTPVAHLPAQTKPTVAIRFCPILFERPTGHSNTFPAFQKLEYKMVFAVATVDSIVLYDTVSALPLAVFGHLHYETITDIAWSRDGRCLAVSSLDCYCSIITFAPGELGDPMESDRIPPHILKRLPGAHAASTMELETDKDAVDRRLEIGLEPKRGMVSLSDKVTLSGKKRIVPEAIGNGVCKESTASGQGAKKRITPDFVQPAALSSPANTTPSCAPSRSETDSDKEPKRITPTPIATTQSKKFENPQGAKTPKENTPKNKGAGGGGTTPSRRRITPIPVDGSGQTVSAAMGNGTTRNTGSIASMALLAGRKAADESGKGTSC